MAEPSEVWRLIRRADELLKYATNRDQATAVEQVRATLTQARAEAEALTERKAWFLEQIAIREADLQR